MIRNVVVSKGADAADDWIVENAKPNDIVITADIPLAARTVALGAHVLGPTGRPFTPETIGMAVAMRDLKQHLRETGESKGYNASFAPQDRSRFLGELDRILRRALKSVTPGYGLETASRAGPPWPPNPRSQTRCTGTSNSRCRPASACRHWLSH